ncbi:folate biopterin transporter [Nannochloropsis gaditana]|uniref:Folate biopterin transporter n=1 Tax=Nannochloropsis gaditana TaxID=72520 RepID=W7U4I1_9STRA|nr:folate biopterin transporter [Nannochloropsis gaditana]
MDVADENRQGDNTPTNASSSLRSSRSGSMDGGSNSHDDNSEEAILPLPPQAPSTRRLVLNTRQNSIHTYESERQASRLEEGGGEGGDGGEGGEGGSTGRKATTPTQKLASFFSIGEGGGLGSLSPRSRLSRLSPRGSFRISPRNFLKLNKRRPMALKTEGSSFENIPPPPGLTSQHTKLISENNSYCRWAEEEARYTDPEQLVSPWSSLNVAITLGAFLFQLTSTFFSVPLAFYVIKNLGMNAAAINVAQQMTQLPQALQIPIGLLTDCVPIKKRRRKYYVLLGWLLHIASMTALAIVGEPDISSLVGLIFLSFLGGQIMDLSQRALIVQRSRHENLERKGVLMVTVNLAWTWGNMLGFVLGTFCYESNFQNGGGMSLANIATFNAAVGVAFLPFLYTLYDPKINSITKTRPIREEMADVWSMVQRKSVLMPMLFVGIFQIFWVPNSAWSVFLIEGLNFSEWHIGLMGLLGSVLGTGGRQEWRECRTKGGSFSDSARVYQTTFKTCPSYSHSSVASLSSPHLPVALRGVGACGAALYRLCLMKTNWRKIFVFTSFIMAGMNSLTLLLVFRVNLRVPPSSLPRFLPRFLCLPLVTSTPWSPLFSL